VPYIQSNVTDEKIKQVFEVSYQLGRVSFIDRVLKEDKNGNHYYSIYVFFDSFNFDDITIRFLEHSQNKEDPPRFYYNYGESGYWKVLLNTSERKLDAPSKKIVLDEEEISEKIYYSEVSEIKQSPIIKKKENEKLFIPRSVINKKNNK